ncbi:mitochondrial resolvase Ydc2 [Phialemonium atrogriseum]|uniref:Mitochondrial resolvase Ydc2 n=1 Tax=Phialemonium atrogriseum TaxID=1093897 RepID=A0AAJ0FLA1_9PEZI|nr:mitochondrial resolvase Ydc2 [Phialemonium atrogriseum]KAK1772421.1 mitochondrial resolvase Ydc2 [Phialemonium atrogriseum]
MTTGLTKLSLGQLRNLTLQCGINRSGTKGVLIQRLDQTLRDHRPLGPDARVLSIDLGIRNLAYSLLSPPLARPSRAQRGSKAGPAVHAWRPLSLAPAPGAAAGDQDQGPADGADEALAADFSPASLSRIALRLVQERLLPLRPTHVLIERQRFRSGGGSAVYEWTVRVNSLEAMLYATFATLQALGHWDGVVLPIDPKRVSTFLLEDQKVVGDDGVERGGEDPDCVPGAKKAGGKARKDATGAEVKSSGRVARENKKRKIDLVGNWLVHHKLAMAGVEATAMRIAFLEKWLPKEHLGKRSAEGLALKGTAESIRKLDDVADSLLQGVAWLRWEENKTKLRQGHQFDLVGVQQESSA